MGMQTINLVPHATNQAREAAILIIQQAVAIGWPPSLFARLFRSQGFQTVNHPSSSFCVEQRVLSPSLGDDVAGLTV
ncbi:predicted protein [Plenodomus lingam JN3]|uniref:Predicted protein n=1 Tax=Leptosphaeria maculans (strain JN3 / isolate v23.1.3 / race Av1-4-5-6-7-8) TaxID=985895 RepID=E4ZU37_LEPMJ|nr:predicted protein [Plenodomus lingam JN3]CBX94747.1 predicted protein [Plenodomus lingam JN3]